mgnify:CR=1 FL=1
MALRDVRRQQGAANETGIQALLDQPGAVAVPGGVALGAMPGGHGDISPNYYDDPTVNAIVGRPSEQQAEDYSGARPSFYGIQRAGDFQRHIQRQMAADHLPGGDRQLTNLIEQRIAKARTANGGVGDDAYANARAFGALR